MLLRELPPSCIAECVLSPRDCPITCGDIILRLGDGTYSPAVDTGAPTLTSCKWQGAALFDVLAGRVFQPRNVIQTGEMELRLQRRPQRVESFVVDPGCMQQHAAPCEAAHDHAGAAQRPAA